MLFLEKYKYVRFSLFISSFRIPQAVKKFTQTEVFLKSSSRSLLEILKECSISRTGYNLRPIFGTGRLGLNRWNCKFYLINVFNSELICTRNFSSFKNKNILSRRKAFGLIREQLREQFSNRSFMASPPPSCLSSLKSVKRIQEVPKRLSKSQRNKTYKTSVYRGPCYPICLHKIHWRKFHSSLFPLAKDSKKNNKISKPTEVKKTDEFDRSCKDKSDVCRQEKVEKPQAKETRVKQTEKKNMELPCRTTCLPIGKCEVPHTVPPPKMTYTKVTCAPPKFVKPESCPPVHEDDTIYTEIKQPNARKKKICFSPAPLPKPPYPPVILCPCPPPSKVHPGSCPKYEAKKIVKKPLVQSCRLKKKYPCPTGVFYCPPQKKSCDLNREDDCERRKKKKTA